MEENVILMIQSVMVGSEMTNSRKLMKEMMVMEEWLTLIL